MSTVKTFQKVLFSAFNPASGGIDCPLGEIKNCARHQLVIAVKPDPAAGTVSVRGISAGSGLQPAKFDSRLDAISTATLGSQIFVFYGLFDALRFDFSGFAGTSRVSAAIVSHEGTLKYSGNAP